VSGLDAGSGVKGLHIGSGEDGLDCGEGVGLEARCQEGIPGFDGRVGV